ncbi:class I SAM-dependent methyltransferase [Solitalea canadensis]|uniref:Methylase involved in ubiquinone/menaquinone biosynthesis n=1 Tax=Solitalea canadensis (strain ATCC 29591 / DSM 3403 / JCM 21819 / LMG 8368 / NBRC 15130 / NCIMB 12057 / USAM 9D) TaxID=929556 RepID=H8KNA9_SOLCM|nr:class I SAM-dependent methyltransferase [Solitalea canadensis]AFD09442.1 methylase involved in ubiquinone/menaquinone biosynthesis [Solitalea canadensis DSM 3403]
MKDNFSKQSDLYAQFRPTYPPELYDFLLPLVPDVNTAWDCGTGNGQVAAELAGYFEKVYATDISISQLNNAVQKTNIFYSIAPAEHTSFTAQSFDLITVAQAIHWFDFNEFYKEVRRTLKPNGIIAVIGYGLLEINPKLDELINYFYTDIVGKYWDKERKYIDDNYQTIPFPFNEIPAPKLSVSYKWNVDQLIGYLNTWSAVQHYKDKNNENPVGLIIDELINRCGSDIFEVKFPTLLRVGKV